MLILNHFLVYTIINELPDFLCLHFVVLRGIKLVFGRPSIVTPYKYPDFKL